MKYDGTGRSKQTAAIEESRRCSGSFTHWRVGLKQWCLSWRSSQRYGEGEGWGDGLHQQSHTTPHHAVPNQTSFLSFINSTQLWLTWFVLLTQGLTNPFYLLLTCSASSLTSKSGKSGRTWINSTLFLIHPLTPMLFHCHPPELVQLRPEQGIDTEEEIMNVAH